MPRDNDKNNDSRGGPNRRSGGKGRSGVPRGPDKKFAKRDLARIEGERSHRGKSNWGGGKRGVGQHDNRRPRYDRDDSPRGDGDLVRSAKRFEGNKFGGKRPYAPRGEDLREGHARSKGDRPFERRSEREFSYGGRLDRSDEKPWQKRKPRDRDKTRGFEAPKFRKTRHDEPREGGGDRPRFSRPREGERPARDDSFGKRQKFDRPRERQKVDRIGERPGRPNDWQEHPRSQGRSFRSDADRPRRDNEDHSKVFPKRPAFGGRGGYRNVDREQHRAAPPARVKKSGERIAKVLARAGLASRREAEAWITQGRITVNGRVINSPALDVTASDVITVDGEPLPPRERTRLFLYHKPRGLMTTHADPEGRPTVFDNLPEGLPRLISVGRLDFNTEVLLLLTNDGWLARALELPETGWLRRYRVRAHGDLTQAQLDELKRGVVVDGVKYGTIEAALEHDSGANVWLVFAIREGKNREVRNVMAHLGLEVNRLIRISYGPFQLAELPQGAVEEVKTRVLREQLGEKVAALARANFDLSTHRQTAAALEDDKTAEPDVKKPFKAVGKSGLIADRKGRRVLVQRSGGEEARARNGAEESGFGPPRRAKRGYHGKRDLKPKDE